MAQTETAPVICNESEVQTLRTLAETAHEIAEARRTRDRVFSRYEQEADCRLSIRVRPRC